MEVKTTNKIDDLLVKVIAASPLCAVDAMYLLPIRVALTLRFSPPAV